MSTNRTSTNRTLSNEILYKPARLSEAAKFYVTPERLKKSTVETVYQELFFIYNPPLVGLFLPPDLRFRRHQALSVASFGTRPARQQEVKVKRLTSVVRPAWLAILGTLSLLITSYAQSPTPGQSVNMVSGTVWPGGDPFLRQQNEPSIAVSTRNGLHLLAGANDYRTVDLPYPDVSSDEEGTCVDPSGMPQSKCAEPWLGLFKSFDGGQRWQSTLVSGYPQDSSSPPSPLKAFSTSVYPATGSDPVVKAGTNGMFYYVGMVFNRKSSVVINNTTVNGVIFVARYIDLDNKENGDVTRGQDPIRYIDTVPIAYSDAAAFLDKPAVAVDIPRSSTNVCNLPSIPQSNGTSVNQSFFAGNVYVAYTQFAPDNTSRLMFKRSADCGAHWSSPVMLSGHYKLNQGATIQIDPETGIVYVAWRVFKHGTQPDAIVGVASIDGGEHFIPPLQLVNLPAFDPANPTAPSFFDQKTTDTSFRTNAYPALAVDDSGFPFVPGRIYLAWAQRGPGPMGDARIMMMVLPSRGTEAEGEQASDQHKVLEVGEDRHLGGDSATDQQFQKKQEQADEDEMGSMFIPHGIHLPVPFAIDNGPITDDFGNIVNPAQPGTTNQSRGHQFMPQMTVAGGKLIVTYYDLRTDHTLGTFSPASPFPDPLGRFYEELLNPLAEPSGVQVFGSFVDDSGLKQDRHTLEVRLAQANPSFTPSFTYARVSTYKFGTRGDGTSILQQLQIDPPNLPLFRQGSVPFFGDYIDVTGLMFRTTEESWRFNSSGSSPVHFVAWTSNQDVRPPGQGHTWADYTPPASGPGTGSGPSIFDPSNSNPNARPACAIGAEGTRNQNIYESRITQGLLVSAPQNSKPLSTTLQRAFTVLVQNFTNQDRSFRLTIANQPPGGRAAFFAVRNNPVPSPIPPAVVPAETQVDVSIAAHSGIARTVFALSTNSTASITVNVAEISAPRAVGLLSGGLTSFVVLDPDGTVPPLISPDGTSVNVGGTEIYNPDIGNPDIGNPDIGNPDIGNPDIGNPDIGNPDIGNLGIPTPDLPNTGVVNPDIGNPDIGNPDIGNGPVSDANYTITNNGNTTASYTIKLVGSSSTPLQLMLSKIYKTPVSVNCVLTEQKHTILQSTVDHPPINPDIGNPDIGNATIGNATLSLAPGDSATITLRARVDLATMQQVINGVVPVAVAQAANTDTDTHATSVAGGIFILTTSLPSGVAGQPYSAQLSAIGGTGALSWGLCVDEGCGSLPPGFSIDRSTGIISFNPEFGIPAPGTYTFIVQVSDSAVPQPHTASKQLSIILTGGTIG